MTHDERKDRADQIIHQAMADLYALGNERTVGEAVHGLVMLWIDERVIRADDPRLVTVTNTLADLAGHMQAERQLRGLDPTVVDRPENVQ